jgi:ABC-2 type transport system permease protein
MTRARQVAAAVGGGFIAEVNQLRRSRLLLVATVVEAITFLVLVSIFGLTGSHVPTAVVDEDGGTLARQWVQDMRGAYRTYGLRYMSASQARGALRRGDVAAVITIPHGFSDRIAGHQMIRVPFEVDNVDADLSDDVERGIPSAAVRFALDHDLPGVRVAPIERDLVDHEADFVPYLVVSALALDAFVVAGLLAATAVAREYEGGTIAGLQLAPVSPMAPLAGRFLATATVSAVAVGAAASLVVVGYGVTPEHPVEAVAGILLCVAIFTCAGAVIGSTVRRTLPLATLVFGLSLPLYIASGSLEPARLDGNLIWAVAHLSPVYHAVGVLQHGFHGLQVTPEPVGLDFAALLGWAVLALAGAWCALRWTARR